MKTVQMDFNVTLVIEVDDRGKFDNNKASQFCKDVVSISADAESNKAKVIAIEVSPNIQAYVIYDTLKTKNEN
jgi:hypothetical protein